ncbi:MAG: DivIVA domain-containing protein, partial [Solirubrobacterales bacterium]
MAVDETSLDRIRNATFPSSRRGYDKHEVEKFLARLADWLETGGGDEPRSDAVKRELERVGERTGAILSQAEESAQQIRSEAEEEARATRAEAKATAEKLRGDADAYAAKTRGDADSYAGETRSTIDRE